MSGGSNTTTSTSSSPGYVQDASMTYLNRANDISTQPYNASPSQYVGPNSYQSSGWEAIMNRAMQGSPVQGAANDTLMKTLQGGFMGSNPYIDDMVNKSQGDLARNYNNVIRPGQDASMIRSGSFGNSGLQQQTMEQDRMLQDSMGNISTQIRGGAYESERQRMQQAMGFAPQFAQQDYYDADRLLQAGNQQNQFSQNQANQNYQWWNEAQNYPKNQLGVLGQAINAVQGNDKTQTTQGPGTSAAAGALGGALTLSQLLGLFGQP